MKMLSAGMGWAKGMIEGQAVVDFAKRMELVDEYEIVDKFCYLGDMLSQEGD